jgi:hypothetical protein
MSLILLPLIFACAEYGACPEPATQPTRATPTHESSSYPTARPDEQPGTSTTDRQPLTIVTIYEDGSVTYSDGATKCVTGAPCDTHDLPPSSYTYDWTTNTAYEDTPTR